MGSFYPDFYIESDLQQMAQLTNIPQEPKTDQRPLIEFLNGRITHNKYPARVVIRKDLINVGCSDITPQALQHLNDKWEESYEPKEKIIFPRRSTYIHIAMAIIYTCGVVLEILHHYHK